MAATHVDASRAPSLPPVSLRPLRCTRFYPKGNSFRRAKFTRSISAEFGIVYVGGGHLVDVTQGDEAAFTFSYTGCVTFARVDALIGFL